MGYHSGKDLWQLLSFYTLHARIKSYFEPKKWYKPETCTNPIYKLIFGTLLMFANNSDFEIHLYSFLWSRLKFHWKPFLSQLTKYQIINQGSSSSTLKFIKTFSLKRLCKSTIWFLSTNIVIQNNVGSRHIPIHKPICNYKWNLSVEIDNVKSCSKNL